MADMIKKATRDGYGEGLLALYEDNKDMIVMDADLAEATRTGKFKKAHPENFFDAGISEQNMMSVAAGIASTGKLVFASSFAMFASGRAYEQVRNSIGYPHLPVKIGATHAGVSVGEDGATHQCNEDIALMRTIPGMTIINPADSVEAKAATIAAAKIDGPVYLRFGRLAVPVFNDEETYTFTPGKGVVIKDGTDVAIFATGLMVNEARIAAETLESEGISAAVINIHTIKPLDEEIVLKYAEKCGVIITAEEHSIIGGLGSAVAETLGEKLPTKMIRIGMNDCFGTSGPATELLEYFGQCAANIADKARAAVKQK